MIVLHVIVHERALRKCVQDCTGAGVREAAQSALREIEQIKASQSQFYLEIPGALEPNGLHPNMPPPSEDLQVYVSGGFRENCCCAQLVVLKEAGYKARFHPAAACSAGGYLFQRKEDYFARHEVFRAIVKKYPDFWD